MIHLFRLFSSKSFVHANIADMKGDKSECRVDLMKVNFKNSLTLDDSTKNSWRQKDDRSEINF